MLSSILLKLKVCKSRDQKPILVTFALISFVNDCIVYGSGPNLIKLFLVSNFVNVTEVGA